MPSFEQQIQERVRNFVADINELVRRQALETLSSALSGVSGRGGAVRGNGGVARAARGARALVGIGGGRRSADQIEATCSALLDRIAAAPGERIEQIGKAIGMRTKDLALPIRKLISEKRIRTEGQRRATKYFPGAGGGASRSRRRRGKRGASQ